MGFGGGSKTKSEPDPKPKIVVNSGSGSGVMDGTVQQANRSESIPDQSSLLSSQYDEDEKLKKGVG